MLYRKGILIPVGQRTPSAIVAGGIFLVGSWTRLP
jgi:hypothetical protein